MHRRSRSSLLGLTFSVVLAPAVVLAPTLTRPLAPHAHPVGPRLHHLDLAGVDRGALARLSPTARAHAPLVLTPAETTTPYSLVGVTWDVRDARTPVDVQVRTRTAGTWTPWHALDGLDDVEADPGSADAVGSESRAGTAPYWVGPSDGVQVRVDGARAPRAMRVELIDPGTSSADAEAGHAATAASSAQAEVAQPTIVPRSGWGADESLRSGTPDYAPPIRVAFVHHTDTTNSYTAAQSASIIRGIYAYHVKSRGWSDIGYNFLIDKYGTIFEGRYGGIDKAVVGAHTGGFNSHSFAASLMGNYSTTQPSTAMLGALERLFAWKLGLSYLDPFGTGTLVSAGGGTARYSAGTSHTFNTISGHRDAGYTTCPGGDMYGKLGVVRTAVRSLLGPSFVLPSVSPATVGLLDAGGFTVRAGAVNPLSWTLTVTDAATGAVIRTVTGTASHSAPVNAVWDRLDGVGLAAPPGRYTLRLDGTSNGRTARSWSGSVVITSPVTLSAPTVAAWNASVPVTGKAPAGSAVQLELRHPGTTSWLPGPLATADSTGHYAASIVLDDDYDLRATAMGYPSVISRVSVAPMFTVPTGLVLGDTLVATGTARPGAAVTFNGRRPASTRWTTTLSTTADPTGGWQLTLPMNGDWSLAATAGGVSTPVVTSYVTPTMSAGSTYVGALGSAVPLSGTGSPGQSIALQARTAGTTTWRTVATAVPGSTGAWAGSVPLTDDLDARAVYHGLTSSVVRSARVRPTAAAPASAPWHSVVALRGTARPGSAVSVSRTANGVTTATTTTASSAGAWSVPFTLDNVTTWWASSGGLSSATGSTAVAPTVTAPSQSVIGRPTAVSGTARPGSVVSVSVRQPGATTFAAATGGRADSAGRWTGSFTPAALGTAALRVDAAGVSAPLAASAVRPALVSPSKAAVRGGTVLVRGWARPGSTVRIQLMRRTATAWSPLATVAADATGAFRVSYAAYDDTRVRAVSPDGASAAGLTKLGPTIAAPASAPRGSTITIRGTARPGATVYVYIRYASETAGLVRRSTTASAVGAWAAAWPLARWVELHAVSNGLRSVTVVTAAR